MENVKTEEIEKTSVFQNGLVWFGAGVSVAEILTGTYFASLGFGKGLLAILVGHVIGGALFFFAGMIGAKTKKSSMETVSFSFGKIGAIFFALLNVIQLVGWTSIMIYDGALSVNEIFPVGKIIWCAVIGLLIFAWILFGAKNLNLVSRIVMALLFVLTVVLCVVVFRGRSVIGGNLSGALDDALSFGAAVELAVAMPLSWLPLISDYTREAKKPFAATLCSTLTYSVVSAWMYVIGMALSLFTGESDIAKIMLKSGLGIVALLILILSTVTTTFLDAWSTGISFESILKKVNGKIVALVTSVVGTILACVFVMDNITGFLYFIGSVFAPMIAILITDFFILKNDKSESRFDILGFLIWVIGFVIYRIFMSIDFVLGSTFMSMICVMIITIIARLIERKIKK